MGKKSSKLYVGMDVQKDSIDLALAEEVGEVRDYGRICGDSATLARTARKRESLGKALVFVYEAAPASSSFSEPSALAVMNAGWWCLRTLRVGLAIASKKPTGATA